MGTWATLTNQPTATTDCHALQLLTDGTVLLIGDQAQRLTPDASGSYVNGTWDAAAADPPYTYQYGCVSLANDGTVFVHGSEFHEGVNKTIRFDPVANTWTDVTGTLHLSSHLSILVLPDGRHYHASQVGGRYINADLSGITTGQPSIDSSHSESGMCLLPDDGALLVHAQHGTAHSRMDPITLAWTRTNNTLPAGWKQPTTRKFTSDNRSPGVTYELGALAYMPKAGKAVLVGGQGDIFTYDLAANTWACPASIPIHGHTDDYRIGTIRSANNGQSAATIASSGSVTLTDAGLGTPSASGSLFVIHTGFTRYARIDYTSKVANGDGTTTYSGLSTGTNYADLATALTTGDWVLKGKPFPTVMDGPAVILPGGHLFFAAGWQEGADGTGGGFNQRCNWYSWDGTSSTATNNSQPGTTVQGEFQLRATLLPNGQVLVWQVDGSNKVHIYTPSGAEATPDAAWKPSIVTFPSNVTPGQTVTLVGEQLSGVHEGGFWGDDGTPRTNFPIVRFTSGSSVYYARTHSFTYRGIASERESSCSVVVPSSIPGGTYDVAVIANGVASDSQSVTVTSIQFGSIGDFMIINSFRFGAAAPAPSFINSYRAAGITTSGLGTLTASDALAGDLLVLYLWNANTADTAWSGLGGWTQRYAAGDLASYSRQWVYTMPAAGSDAVSPVADATDGALAGHLVVVRNAATWQGADPDGFGDSGTAASPAFTATTNPCMGLSFAVVLNNGTNPTVGITSGTGWTALTELDGAAVTTRAAHKAAASDTDISLTWTASGSTPASCLGLALAVH